MTAYRRLYDPQMIRMWIDRLSTFGCRFEAQRKEAWMAKTMVGVEQREPDSVEIILLLLNSPSRYIERPIFNTALQVCLWETRLVSASPLALPTVTRTRAWARV